MAQGLSRDVLKEPVSNHMRTDFIRLSGDQTVSAALESILEQPTEGHIIYFYVTDADGALRGVVPTRRLLLSPRNRRIDEIMISRVIAIPKRATVLDACEFFLMHKLLAFPVVDEQRRIVGLVDVELYTKEMSDLDRREDNDALFQLIGVHLSEASQKSPFQAFRRRFPWLLTNIAGGILAAFLAGLYELELQRVVALALFIPVVLALAESVSIQSVSIALQALSGHRPTWKDLAAKLGRESITGSLLGGACGLLVALVGLAWIGRLDVAICLAGGIGGGVACAALYGLAIPNILRIASRNPQVAAGPIALAATDLTTLLIYLNLARLLT